jgi:hypothetical protein
MRASVKCSEKQSPLHDVVVVRKKASTGRSRPGRGTARVFATRFVHACPALFHAHLPPLQAPAQMPSLSSVTSVKISPAGRAPTVARGLPVTLDVPGSWEDLTVGAVKAALADKFPKVRSVHSISDSFSIVTGHQFYPTRQKLSLVGDRKPLEDDTLLKDAGLTEAAPELAAKDLGPQISWKTVFLVEYVRAPVPFASGTGSLTSCQFGPLWIHPLFYYLPQLFYGRAMQHSTLQQYVVGPNGALLVLNASAAGTYSLRSCFTTLSASSRRSCEQC